MLDDYFLHSAVDELLPSFIGCLESHDHGVVSAAITSIPDLVLLCKGKHCMIDCCFIIMRLILSLVDLELNLYQNSVVSDNCNCQDTITLKLNADNH